ncbi:hypothetical protein PMAYCL1PPCAC_10444 [Pristionchus mayeri]|uniref:Phosphotransferase n=1 Tax=Pristionchus mayeri TaxID=1317129 RepID=A0AAN5CEQ7_9BILA|nr:hypothetical protein PMAYCL1PPCAC_10444 [Pristionchus mayeri]
MDNGVNESSSSPANGTGDLKALFSSVRAGSPIPSEVVSKAQSLCFRYLSGSWKSTPADRFSMRQLTGGMSNLLFLVVLCESIQLKNSEPRRAVLRIHCQSDNEQLLTESVVFSILSERKLGPRLLGVFPGGRFEEYLPSRPLQCQEISQPRFISKIAPKLAQVHSLDIPLRKHPRMINRMRGWIEKWSSLESSKHGIEMKLTLSKVDPSKYPSHLSLENLNAEVAFVERFLATIHSPVVFSHNDLSEGNILLMEKGDADDTDELVLTASSTATLTIEDSIWAITCASMGWTTNLISTHTISCITIN